MNLLLTLQWQSLKKQILTLNKSVKANKKLDPEKVPTSYASWAWCTGHVRRNGHYYSGAWELWVERWFPNPRSEIVFEATNELVYLIAKERRFKDPETAFHFIHEMAVR